MNIDLLHELLCAHSTPGDEEEVRKLLEREWSAAGLAVTTHGKYCVTAERTESSPAAGKPTLLICAHMDSPGFTIDVIKEDTVRLVPLGGAHFEQDSAPVILKTGAGTRHILLKSEQKEEGGRPTYLASIDTEGVTHGDRACFVADPQMHPDGSVHSPFLDNRLGCWILCELSRQLPALTTEYRVVLGATACEEIGGFGAPVLARAVEPDVVICLDATYEDEEQGVILGAGPVLTLSDASVIVSPSVRDAWQSFFNDAGLPLQTEVYNYSGTDSRAFPHAGLSCPVYALLLPTRGNHSPQEEGNLADAENLRQALLLLMRRGLP